jgi:sigma-54-dependent transcriptional regulator
MRKETLEAAAELFALVNEMAAERDLTKVALRCLEAACRIAGAQAGVLYTLDHTGTELVPIAGRPCTLARGADTYLPLYPSGRPNMSDPRTWCAFTGRTAVIDNVLIQNGYDGGAIQRRDDRVGHRTRSILAQPLRDCENVTIGVLEIINIEDSTGRTSNHDNFAALIPVISAFAYQTAIVLSNAKLMERNRALVEQLNVANGVLGRENRRLREERISVASRAGGIISRSPAVAAVLELVGKVADSAVPVLVTGETGTGKELIARLVHAASPRRDGPFIPQNCAALPPDLLESELFGYRKGAFTGAVADKKGLFEAANGGTLFLDEVGEMPLALQAKLLRVLQHGEVRALGATQGQRFDVRVVAATNSDLRQLVAEGLFREDLLYRIAVFPVHLPPLRDRIGDIPLLVAHMIAELRQTHRKDIAGIHPDALAALERHPFPGNVRELKNIIERAVILCRPGNALALEDLPHEVCVNPALSPVWAGDAGEQVGAFRAAVQRSEQSTIADALAAVGGNRTRAAKALGISRRSLQDKIVRYGLGKR